MSEPVDSAADQRQRAEPSDGASAKNTPTPGGEAPESGGSSGQNAAGGDGPRRNNNRRRGSRGGRGRKKPAGESTAAAAKSNGGGERPDLPERIRENKPSADAAAKALIPKPKIGDSRPAPAADNGGTDDDSATAGTGAKRRRRRGGRGRGGSGGGNDGGGGGRASATVEAEALALDEETLAQRRGRERKGRPVGRYLMTVHVRPEATQIGVLEGRALIEHYVSRPQDDATQIHGNIYLGRVQNVLPGMEAAFVDIGTPKNAVLYRGDVQYDPEDVVESGAPRIEQMLKARQTILCQVTKNPIGTKGARLTQEVSLPGRFVVLIPNSTTYGISKRLADDERKRLRRILDSVKPEGHGLIVRTAAENATPDELRRDVERLLRQWTEIDGLAKRSKAPALLYREPDLAVRIIREEFNREYRGVVIDDQALYDEVHEYVSSLIPELEDRVEYFDPSEESLPLFERYHVHEQLHKALDRKVWLPSGGSLIIERTEALTVIDVNTGKNVGTSSLEETVFRNNLEAAEEIARQLRLRDIGGIIVIDFIDMEIKKNRDEVLRSFKSALARDKTRTQVFEISELGLVEMTRKRVSEGLVESFSLECPTCNGRGLILDESLLD
ncbi:MAG: Rne/Rng family ribonuclease [Acidimicrobiia bacterium]|nr:Rne/Rng family ribonuclease [Acidimicrobiia bacterium]